MGAQDTEAIIVKLAGGIVRTGELLIGFAQIFSCSFIQQVFPVPCSLLGT